MNIVVLAGGTSSERDVSIATSRLVCGALRKLGHKAVMADVFWGCELKDASLEKTFAMEQDLDALAKELTEKTPQVDAENTRRKRARESFFGKNILALCAACDIVFMGLHGANGEDGRIQAAFDLMNIQYTGTDYLSSAIAMNKALTKRLVVAAGVPMPKGILVTEDDTTRTICYPCVVKPCCGGSSVGVSIVRSDEEYEAALKLGFTMEKELLVEEYIQGRELSVGVIDGKALPVIEIEPISGFYDYTNKYQAGATKEICPAQIPEHIESKIQHYAETACAAVGVVTYGRVDFMMGENGSLYCLEVNTLPGMTSTSLLPQEAAVLGVSYEQLCADLIRISLEKYEK